MIEREKLVDIAVPSEWPVIFKQIDTGKMNKMSVKPLKHTDFFDVKEYASTFPNFHKDDVGEIVINWNKVKVIMVKSLIHIQYFSK